MKVFGLFLCILFLFSIGFAQQTTNVTGQLKDGGEVIANRPIKLVSPVQTFETSTDSAGNYQFTDVPNGRYLLVYGGKQASVIVGGGKVTIAELADAVEISAGASQTVEQVSKTVDVITGQEMRDRADFSLIESLRTIPGFRTQQLGGFGRTATIKTRGLRNQDTAVLLDGIRFRDGAAITGDASPFISDFTLTSVSRIEVLRGSGSSVYGTNAIGGVVDFKTPEAALGTHGQLSGAFGGLGLRRFRGNISHGTANGKFGVGGGLSRTVYTKGIDGQDDAHNTNFQTRIDANPLANTNISGRIFVSNADVRLNVNPDTRGVLPSSVSTIIDADPAVNFIPDANDPDSIQHSRFFSGQISVDHAFSNQLVLSGYYQGLNTRRQNTDGPLGPGFQSAFESIFKGRIDTINSHINWIPSRLNALTVGYEFEREYYSNISTTPTHTSDSTARALQRSNTFYLQDLVSLLDDRLQLAGGFRVQGFQVDRPVFSVTTSPFSRFNFAAPPTAYTVDGSVSYFIPTSRTKFRAHAGNGYHAPSMYERLGSYFFAGSFFPLGNPELKPERSIGVDAGIEQYFAKENVKLSATWFYTRIKDEITYLPTNDFTAPSYYNFDRHFSRGVEVSGSAKASSSTDFFASYTFTNSDIRNFRRPTNSSVASTDRRALAIPDHQFTLVATQRFHRLWINFDFLATSTYLGQIFSNSTFSTYTYRFRGNRKGDLTAGYTFALKSEKKTLRLYGTVENVFNQEYFENGFRTAKTTARVGLTFGF